MYRHLFLSIATAVSMAGTLMLGMGGAGAQNLCPGVSATQCTDLCGSAGVASCTKTGSTPDCVCNTTTKDVNGNANGTATTDSGSGQGNLGNKTETSCTGNTGQCKK